jgi:hypothetical protein
LFTTWWTFDTFHQHYLLSLIAIREEKFSDGLLQQRLQVGHNNPTKHPNRTSELVKLQKACTGLLPDEALLASQLKGAWRASIEKAYNVALH